MTASSATPQTATSTLRPGALRPDVEHHEKPMPSEVQLESAALSLRKAWGVYLVLGAIPPLAMIGAVFYLILLGELETGREAVSLSKDPGWWFFLLGMAWISAWVPISFYIRRRCWDEYYRGGVVASADYLKGNLAIWLPLVFAGVLGFIGLAATGYVANLLTSLTAFIVFLSMFPNGHAMTRAVGDHDDPGVYEEPK